AKAKVLLNVHFDETYQIFEHFRCDRWALAGMIVITEKSLSDHYLDLKDLLIIETYENLKQTIHKVLNNYDFYAQQLQQKLQKSKATIIKKRTLYCQNFAKIWW